MSLSSISGDSAATAALQQRRNALKQLDTDAEAGNFAAAQSDLAAFQQTSQTQATTTSSTATASSTVAASSLQSDLTALLNAALGSASTSASSLQSSATQVENDLAGFSGFTNAASTNPLSGALNTLLSAAQSGDAASAKQAAQTLIQDLQGSSTSQSVAGAHGHHHHHGGGGDSDDLTPTTDQLIDPTASAGQTQAVGGLPQFVLDALNDTAPTSTASNKASTGGSTAASG